MSESRTAMLVALFLAEKTAIFFMQKMLHSKQVGKWVLYEIPLHILITTAVLLNTVDHFFFSNLTQPLLGPKFTQSVLKQS